MGGHFKNQAVQIPASSESLTFSKKEELDVASS